MAFYLIPLRESIKTVRTELITMRNKGQHRCKYYIEENEPMHGHVIDMVKKDVTAQWLMRNKLKIDQLWFLFDVCTIIFRSPLKEKLEKKDKIIVENVLPMLSWFEALLKIRSIMITQAEEKKKGTLVAPEEDKSKEAEEKKDSKTVIAIETDTLPPDEPDIEKYGRKWIWHINKLMCKLIIDKKFSKYQICL